MFQMISVVICSADPHKFQAVKENYLRLAGDEPLEVIGIQDARSMSEGYNRGVRQSTGDILIFCHEDIEILSPDFKDRLRGHLSRHDLIGVAGTNKLVRPQWAGAGPPYLYGQIAQLNVAERCYDVCIWCAPARAVTGIQALDGVFLAATRRLVEAVSFDEQIFQGFHLYDLDFSFTAHLLGFRLAVCNDLLLIHESWGSFDDEWRRQAQLFRDKYRHYMVEGERRIGCATFVRVHTKEEVLEVMNPGHWQEE
jgi:GT2 family glycosyltransferase